jgi:hypothetical protein
MKSLQYGSSAAWPLFQLLLSCVPPVFGTPFDQVGPQLYLQQQPLHGSSTPVSSKLLATLDVLEQLVADAVQANIGGVVLEATSLPTRNLMQELGLRNNSQRVDSSGSSTHHLHQPSAASNPARAPSVDSVLTCKSSPPLSLPISDADSGRHSKLRRLLLSLQPGIRGMQPEHMLRVSRALQRLEAAIMGDASYVSPALRWPQLEGQPTGGKSLSGIPASTAGDTGSSPMEALHAAVGAVWRQLTAGMMPHVDSASMQELFAIVGVSCHGGHLGDVSHVLLCILGDKSLFLWRFLW